jgi:UDP-N-acetylglucosamine acyltransferase
MTSFRERIHPTAIISLEAELADDVQVGPYAIIEGPVRIGVGSIIEPQARLIGPLTMGARNQVCSNAVLGGRPQHAGYKNESTTVEIGDGNIFREGATVHRGTAASMTTRIGDGNTFMVGSHVGHDCVVGNRCTLVNYAMLGGHCILEDGVIVSGGAAVHQFCRLGRLSLLSGVGATSKDIPPFVMQRGLNTVSGLNLVGMRRAGFTLPQINGVRRLFHIMYGKRLTVSNALAEADAELGHIDVVAEFIKFVRASKRGINRMHEEDEPKLAA